MANKNQISDGLDFTRRDEFSYLEEKDLPCLFLGMKISHDFQLLKKKTPYNKLFSFIAHQTGGISCNQHYFDGFFLKPKSKIRDKMIKLDEDYLGSGLGTFGQNTLDEILDYRNLLQVEFNVDCSIAYKDLEEGIYPIDCYIENIEKLTNDYLLQSFDDYLIFKTQFASICGSIGRWNLYILGRNSD